MKTFYLIDFENFHNDGIENIESMTKEEHVHIFSTQNATNIRQDIFKINQIKSFHLSIHILFKAKFFKNILYNLIFVFSIEV